MSTNDAAAVAADRPSDSAGTNPAPWIMFLSDYGLEDAFVGVCKGVIAGICPAARVLDVCHQVAPQDVEHGAITLALAISYLPVGVHLALVDPLRSRTARPVAIRTCNGATFVGPDNGLTSLCWDASGGVESTYEITNSALWLPNPSRTFRGRDIFAPIAAQLAAGRPLSEVGEPLDHTSLERLTTRDATVDDDHVHAEIRMVDHFGNLALNVHRADLEAAGIQLGDDLELRCGGKTMRVPFTVTYGGVAPGRVAVCEDSFRTISVAVNLGHANQILRARRGDSLVLSRVPRPVPEQTGPIGVLEPAPQISTA